MAARCPMCHSSNHLPTDQMVLGDCGTLTTAGQSLHLPTLSLLLVGLALGVIGALWLWRWRRARGWGGAAARGEQSCLKF